MSSNAPIAEFYRRHPYPKVIQVRCEPNLLDHIYYVAGGCFEHPAPLRGSQRGRMLVAGSGTSEAVNWAMSLPHFDVDAVDLSTNSIAVAQHLAEQLKLKNLTLREGNIEEGTGFDGPYDFISSMGVLHHLQQPERGLAQLVGHLAPHGVMAVMLYSDSNRWFLQRGQRLFQVLLQGLDDPEQRQAEAHAVCEAGSQNQNRLQVVFQSGVNNYHNDRSQFADTLLNPQEVSYTIPRLLEFAGSAGMRVVTPVFADIWNPRAALGEQGTKRYEQLPVEQQWEICDLILGPIFWFAMRHDSQSRTPRPCLTDEALFWQIVPMPMTATIHDVHELVIAKSGSERGTTIEPADGDQVRISRNREAWSTFHRVAATMLELIDGKQTLRQIAEAAAHQHGTTIEQAGPTLLAYLHHLIDHIGAATADVTQCHRCPARQAYTTGH
jgi:SAM-dependent methyltransferase